VFDRLTGQNVSAAFLRRAAERPHHAYVFAGPEGSGKSIGARAFAAALLCPDGGCDTCRHCRLALTDHHPNLFVVEPEGRDIHVDTVRAEVWQPAFRTAPEPGRKVFVLREADRLSPAAADTLLKVLEEPPPETVLLLLSARAHELPPTVWSRCHIVTFAALSETFVVATLVGEGVPDVRARLAARLAGGNLGRARRLTADDGLTFRSVALEALGLAATGAPGALAAADRVLGAAGDYRKGMKAELEQALAPFVDERGRPEESYRGAIRRIEIRFQRRERRAERDYIDWVLLAASAIVRDRIAAEAGVADADLINPDLPPDPLDRGDVGRAGEGIGAIEVTRAALADDVNLNPRLVLEGAFLQLGGA